MVRGVFPRVLRGVGVGASEVAAVSEKRSPEARARRAVKRKQAIREQQRQRVVDAAERRVVRLADGRTGRLLSVPAHSSHVSQGAKARVILQSGAIVSVPLSELVVEA